MVVYIRRCLDHGRHIWDRSHPVDAVQFLYGHMGRTMVLGTVVVQNRPVFVMMDVWAFVVVHMKVLGIVHVRIRPVRMTIDNGVVLVECRRVQETVGVRIRQMTGMVLVVETSM